MQLVRSKFGFINISILQQINVNYTTESNINLKQQFKIETL